MVILVKGTNFNLSNRSNLFSFCRQFRKRKISEIRVRLVFGGSFFRGRIRFRNRFGGGRLLRNGSAAPIRTFCFRTFFRCFVRRRFFGLLFVVARISRWSASIFCRDPLFAFPTSKLFLSLFRRFYCFNFKIVLGRIIFSTMIITFLYFVL